MLITNIGTLVTNDPELGTLTDASIVFDAGKVAWVGQKPPEQAGTTRVDAALGRQARPSALLDGPAQGAPSGIRPRVQRQVQSDDLGGQDERTGRDARPAGGRARRTLP